MIIAANKDSQIFNCYQFLISLIKEFLNAGKNNIVISLNSEGPCAEMLGLYDILENYCEIFSIPHQQVEIHTANLIEHHPTFQIVKSPTLKYLNAARQVITDIGSSSKTFDGAFKIFGNFIGHGNEYRLIVASHLWNHHKHNTLQTYHFSRDNDYHSEFVGLEKMMFHGCSQEEIDSAYTFLKNTPSTLDQINNYPILSPTTYNLFKVYPRFFIEIVNQTYFSGNCFHFDEKIIRPMIMKTPFIVQGPIGFIKNLHRLGFRTFDRWWSEEYDSRPDNNWRVQDIKNLIDQISNLNQSQLKIMYEEMSEILEHNYQRIWDIKPGDFSVL